MQLYRTYFLVCTFFMGISFTSGIILSICAITIMHNKTNIVAGVGLMGFSAIVGLSSFLTYLLWNSTSHETNIVTINVSKSKTFQDNTFMIVMVYEEDSVHIATGINTPPKIVVFEPHVSEPTFEASSLLS